MKNKEFIKEMAEKKSQRELDAKINKAYDDMNINGKNVSKSLSKEQKQFTETIITNNHNMLEAGKENVKQIEKFAEIVEKVGDDLPASGEYYFAK